MKLNLLVVLFSVLLSACSSSVVTDTYQHTRTGSSSDTQTAFIILAHISLDQIQIEQLENDYINETDSSRKFLYEYVLAKRTQQQNYITLFINNARNNTQMLLHKSSLWISISSPTLSLLSYYSSESDQALRTLLTLLFKSDGAVQSIIASELHDLYEFDQKRFTGIVQKMDLDIKRIFLLMEDEQMMTISQVSKA